MNEEKYYCAICGKGYDSVKSRIACETKCFKEYQEAEAKKKADEIQKNRDASEKAIEKKLEEVNEMIGKHLKDYETFHLNGNYYYLRYIFNKSMWWF